ncbi:MAG: AzlD domain-containing protein [Trueperaceae bacterium]|nr:AzlD domain-containing protein [Trueperaceae bacterium]
MSGASGAAALWALLLAMAALTLTLRGSFFVFGDRIRIPPLVRRALDYVPAAVLAAIVAPAFVQVAPGEAVDVLEQAPRWAAGLVGVAAALLTRNMLVVLALGMATLWGVQALLG